MEAIIELKDIKKAYGQTEVLNHFDLSIDQGEFITIIGTSGSGKTTVLKNDQWLNSTYKWTC